MITSDFAAYAVKIDVHFERPVPSAEIQTQVEGLMTKITMGCLKAGADLIGHIKCIVETSGHGFLAVSVTNHDGIPMSKGQLDEGIKEMDVIVNCAALRPESQEDPGPRGPFGPEGDGVRRCGCDCGGSGKGP